MDICAVYRALRQRRQLRGIDPGAMAVVIVGKVQPLLVFAHEAISARRLQLILGEHHSAALVWFGQVPVGRISRLLGLQHPTVLSPSPTLGEKPANRGTERTIAQTSWAIVPIRSDIDQTLSATGLTFFLIDVTQNVIDAGQSVIDAGQSVIDGGQSVIDGGRSVIVPAWSAMLLAWGATTRTLSIIVRGSGARPE